MEKNLTKLEAKRREKQLSRRELADKVGITYEAIMYYEKGEREPRASILKRLAEVLGCTMEELI